MRFVSTGIEGCWVVEWEPRRDERGFLARAFCADELATHGCDPRVAQVNIASTRAAGTVRGLHRQRGEEAEAKLVRCLRGRAFDVAVDVRPGSPTHRCHVGVELDADGDRALYVPPWCAHGYQTLEDDTELLYTSSRPYDPDAEEGFRVDDPAFAIPWPLPVKGLSEKDRSWPLLG